MHMLRRRAYATRALVCWQHCSPQVSPVTRCPRTMATSVKQQVQTRKKQRSVVYVRTSTKTNQNNSRVKRGRQAALAAASVRKDDVKDVFHEVADFVYML